MAERSGKQNQGGERTHANRDRSDVKGENERTGEKTGPRGSGRSPANEPAPERNTRDKQKP